VQAYNRTVLPTRRILLASLAHVTNITSTRSFPINGGTLTVRQALADFYRVEADAVEATIAGKTVRIVNRGPVTDLNVRLAENDTVTIFESEVATGGVKGAIGSANGR
jgi:hypothetical protein